jgi:predicted peptidase
VPLLGAGQAAAQVVEEVPRTNAPVEQYTHFFTKMAFEAGNRRLAYYLFQPKAAAAASPLVVVLHGGPGVAYAAKYLISAQMQASYPAFVLVPQSPNGKFWAMPAALSPAQVPPGMAYDYHPELESLPDVAAIIESLKKTHAIDGKRIYIVGCSDGGTGVYGAVLRYPDLFAAGVATSGTWSLLDAPKMTRVPLQIWHGANDTAMPVAVARAMAEGIRQGGGQVTYSELQGVGHQCAAPDFYSMAVWQWLFAQKKG